MEWGRVNELREGTRLRRPVGRPERKKQEVEQRIREAALALFREKGYEATTVEEIAERADVAKGTFFNYFPRMDGLLGGAGGGAGGGAAGLAGTGRGVARHRT